MTRWWFLFQIFEVFTENVGKELDPTLRGHPFFTSQKKNAPEKFSLGIIESCAQIFAGIPLLI